MRGGGENTLSKCKDKPSCAQTNKAAIVCTVVGAKSSFQTFFMYLGTGRCPGPVVMVGDLRSIGRGFETQHHQLDGHFFTFIYPFEEDRK